jgi:hypothetical protein
MFPKNIETIEYPVVRAYRYVNFEKWKKQSSSQKEIKPRKVLFKGPSIINPDLPKVPLWSDCKTYIFTFANSPLPQEWQNYEHFQEELETLMSDIGDNISIIKFDLLPSDEAYVVDRAHYVDWQYGINPNRADAILKYVHSRIPAGQYHGQFRLPELIIGNPISIDRIVLHETILS